MKRSILTIATAAALLCAAPVALADTPNQAPPRSAPLLTALALIVPQPYEINVDNSIPTDTRLSWADQGDWEQQLRQAANSAGLGVHFSAGQSLLVFRLPRIHRVTVGPEIQNEQRSATPRNDAWSTPAPAMPAHAVHLIDAIQTLIPPEIAPTLRLEILATDLNTPARWLPGARWSALKSMLRGLGLQVRLQGKTLRIAPISDTGNTDAAYAADPDSVLTAVAAPIASGLNFMPGHPLGEQLCEQGKAQGWTVVWNVSKDWIVPSATALGGDFQTAATQAIEAAASEGAPISARIYPINRTIVVEQTGVTNH